MTRFPPAVRRVRDQGQGHGEGATDAGFALDLYLTAEVLGDLSREGEAEASTVRARGALGAVEAVEDVWYLGLGDAAAFVRDADDGVAVLPGEPHVDGRFPVRILQGIVH